MDIVLLIHSLVRFLILLVALIGIVKALVSLIQKTQSDKLDQTIASAFLGLYDLQALLGVLIILLGGLSQAIHPIVMIVGILLAHGLQTMVKRADATKTATVPAQASVSKVTAVQQSQMGSRGRLVVASILVVDWIESIIKPVDSSRAHLIRLALYIVPLLVILVGLASIGHLPV